MQWHLIYSIFPIFMRDAILKKNIEYNSSDYHVAVIFFIRQTFLLENRPQDESPLEVASL